MQRVWQAGVAEGKAWHRPAVVRSGVVMEEAAGARALYLGSHATSRSCLAVVCRFRRLKSICRPPVTPHAARRSHRQ